MPLDLAPEEGRPVDEHPMLVVELQGRYSREEILLEVTGHEAAAFLQVPRT